jgi:hypothetical protein
MFCVFFFQERRITPTEALNRVCDTKVCQLNQGACSLNWATPQLQILPQAVQKLCNKV